MNKRSLLASGVILAAFASVDGCFHRTRIGPMVSPPRDLDSVATAKWVDAQRAACPGVLQMLVDEGSVRDLDGVFRYHSPLVGVQCVSRR